MNILVTQGLRIRTRCKYVKFTYAKFLNIIEDEEINCLKIEFPIGFSSDLIVDRRVTVLKPSKLLESEYIEIINPIIDLNGLKLMRLTQKDYTINQFIVNDITKFTMNYNEDHCEILIPKMLDWNLKKYVSLFEKNPYLEVVCDKQLKSLNNFYSINMSDRSVILRSSNNFPFNSKNYYEKYLLSSVDILDSFLSIIEIPLKTFGMELLSLPIDKKQISNHRVTYRITDLDRQESHKTAGYPLRYAVQHSTHIEMGVSTPDLSVFADFKSRYQNLDLLTNLTEFRTNDALGRSWVSNIQWNPIDTSFTQDYSQDEQQAVAFEAKFSADLHYYIVYDIKYYNAQKIVLDMLGTDLNQIESTSESDVITI